jgi:hypothetical protein
MYLYLLLLLAVVWCSNVVADETMLNQSSLLDPGNAAGRLPVYRSLIDSISPKYLITNLRQAIYKKEGWG